MYISPAYHDEKSRDVLPVGRRVALWVRRADGSEWELVTRRIPQPQLTVTPKIPF